MSAPEKNAWERGSLKTMQMKEKITMIERITIQHSISKSHDRLISVINVSGIELEISGPEGALNITVNSDKTSIMNGYLYAIKIRAEGCRDMVYDNNSCKNLYELYDKLVEFINIYHTPLRGIASGGPSSPYAEEKNDTKPRGKNVK